MIAFRFLDRLPGLLRPKPVPLTTRDAAQILAAARKRKQRALIRKTAREMAARLGRPPSDALRDR